MGGAFYGTLHGKSPRQTVFSMPNRAIKNPRTRPSHDGAEGGAGLPCCGGFANARRASRERA
jgi:hypothetical protein